MSTNIEPMPEQEPLLGEVPTLADEAWDGMLEDAFVAPPGAADYLVDTFDDPHSYDATAEDGADDVIDPEVIIDNSLFDPAVAGDDTDAAGTDGDESDDLDDDAIETDELDEPLGVDDSNFGGDAQFDTGEFDGTNDFDTTELDDPNLDAHAPEDADLHDGVDGTSDGDPFLV